MLQCDTAAWQRLATTVTEVRPRADNSYPLGDALLNLRHDPSITLYLSPVAKPQSPSMPSNPRWTPYQPTGKGEKGQGKTKTKGKLMKGVAPPMPKELRGKYHRTSAGEPLCFRYNTTQGCPHTDIKAG